ncbi:LGFP repeat-containing protein [Dictyobacter kobayashii]|uniref:LGFP repeat-containing protein n=1 Tax=Dictyobacter kobayashii TaxID=2014872 RepID=A0A402AVB7_9CHLR|nr:hypothetical protein [Dictyobacter kobayashii]GCE23058.1 hypothetical protein KDK_68580 [Dictyobacter kobayashii]
MYHQPIGHLPPDVQIGLKFELLGGQAVLGVSQGDAAPTLNNTGFFQNFSNGWSIFWSPVTGAHEVHGDIRAKWAEFNYERGFLGYPVSDETGAPDGIGRYNHFQGGSIYWSPSTGAHEVHGDIRGKWAELGWERSFLGYPVTDETGAPDGIGRYNHFQGGSIYWSPSTGAHEVHGDIRGKWAELGWERSFLGYPVSDEHDCPPGRCSDFQNGTISWTLQGGSQEQPQTYVVDAPDITFGTGIAAGGNATLTLASNGVVTFRGHLHDSGLPSYDFLAVFSVKDSNGQSAYTASHAGRLHGSDEAGSRDGDWNETINSDLVRQNWPLVRAGSSGWKVEVTSDWSPQKIAEDVLSVVGTTVGIVALFI